MNKMWFELHRSLFATCFGWDPRHLSVLGSDSKSHLKPHVGTVLKRGEAMLQKPSQATCWHRFEKGGGNAAMCGLLASRIHWLSSLWLRKPSNLQDVDVTRGSCSCSPGDRGIA